MMLGARIGAWTPSGAPLPYDAEVEYLETTTSGVYIELPLNASKNIGISTDIEFVGARRYFGTNISTHWYGFYSGTATNKIKFIVLGGTIREFDLGYNIPRRLSFKWEKPSNKVFIDGEYVGEFSPNGEDSNAYIRACGNQTVGFNGKTYYLKYYNGSGEMILDLIPVRFTNENGVSEGAMYDRVSGQLFRNAGTGTGTGAFVIGPDKT